MALGLARNFPIELDQNNLGRFGPGSSVAQASYLPSNRPWLATGNGGRSSQVNTARGAFWIDPATDAVLDPTGLDAQTPVYNDVFVGAISKGVDNRLGDDNDWMTKSPNVIASYSTSQLESRLQWIVTYSEEGSPLGNSANQILQALEANPSDPTAKAQAEAFLIEIALAYQDPARGADSWQQTNAYLSELLMTDPTTQKSSGNLSFLQYACQLGQNSSATNDENSFWAVGNAAMTQQYSAQGETLTPDALDFSQLVANLQWLEANQPQTASAIAFNLVQGGYNSVNQPTWQAWPGVFTQSGQPATLAPSLWVGAQAVNQAATQTSYVTPGGQTVTATAAQIAYNEALYDACFAVRTWFLWYNGYTQVAPLKPLTPTGGNSWEDYALAGAGVLAAGLVLRQLFS